jgi:WD40 repeat protein
MCLYRPATVTMGIAILCPLLLVSVSWVLADDKPPAPEGKKEAADEKTLRALIAQLGDESFDKREAAAKRLAEIGEPALKLIESAVEQAGDPEVRARATALVRVIAKSFLQELRRFDGHTRDKGGEATRVAVSSDGKFLVTAGSGMVRYWEIESGKELAAFGSIARSSFYALSISKDGKHVIAGGGDRLVRVFEVPSGKQVQEFAQHKGIISGAVLLHNGKQAVSAGFDQLIYVWDLETGKVVRTFDAIGECTRGVALSPDGKVLAAAQCRVIDGSPGVARLWDIETGKVIRTMEGHTMNTTSVAFAPDGNTLLASGYDGVIRVWDIKTAKELKVFDGSPQGIAQATFTADGRRIVAAGQRHVPTLRVWDIASGKMVVESDTLGDGVFGVAPVPDPQSFLSASRDGIVRLWRYKR